MAQPSGMRSGRLFSRTEWEQPQLWTWTDLGHSPDSCSLSDKPKFLGVVVRGLQGKPAVCVHKMRPFCLEDKVPLAVTQNCNGCVHAPPLLRLSLPLGLGLANSI